MAGEQAYNVQVRPRTQRKKNIYIQTGIAWLLFLVAYMIYLLHHLNDKYLTYK